MTGIESGAIAGVAKAASKAMQVTNKEKEYLLQIAEREGALRPAAKSMARRIALKQQIRLHVWQSVAMVLGLPREDFITELEDELADRLQDVPEDDLVTPPMNVAGPAVQGVTFTAAEPNLRAMYLNLLAVASDRRKQQAAHPSFAEIIKQLDSTEASWLARVLYADGQPIVEVRMNYVDNSGYEIAATNLLDLRDDEDICVTLAGQSLWVDNWQRLGLIYLDWTARIAGPPSAYDWVDTNPLFLALKEKHTREGVEVTFAQGSLRVTEYGQSFFRVAVAPAVYDDAVEDGSD